MAEAATITTNIVSGAVVTASVVSGTTVAANVTTGGISTASANIVNVQLAANPDALIVGAITRDANEAATLAAVVWPDNTSGIYTADTVSSSFPGAVDAYHITYGGTKTYTQPLVTRDAQGAVTNRPAIVLT